MIHYPKPPSLYLATYTKATQRPWPPGLVLLKSFFPALLYVCVGNTPSCLIYIFVCVHSAGLLCWPRIRRQWVLCTVVVVAEKRVAFDLALHNVYPRDRFSFAADMSDYRYPAILSQALTMLHSWKYHASLKPPHSSPLSNCRKF